MKACLFKTALTFVLISLVDTFQPLMFRAAAENGYSIYVDGNGRMRRSDTGSEVRYFGTNYTLPFAHAYRAMRHLGVPHKEAIDRDVYHLSRMGINAFRLHLWDVEISDSIGNLVENDHLDLLDYLLAKLEERGISIILTAQTNFGNGYPERDTDTGAFTYDYEKCSIHSDPDAIKAQQRYIGQLARHRNRYTGRTYADDNSIIAVEINNEPCHQSSPEQVTRYIDSMAKALRRNGWEKPILYNVSHNMEMVPGYYAADIEGTTYQWYPTGLVSGHERKGNFLPYVDDYRIPFSDIRGFDKKARIVYEFDPADILQSYLFPAVARTFARNGFQWATQFAYDPIDMARFNTEYQTHYLNLAYTPQKAIGMKIAARAMQQTPFPCAGTETYPADTIFGDITVSYRRNLASLNSATEYFHTNDYDEPPVCPDSLLAIAGYGSSPAVGYEGRGAYFLDRTDPGTWRLEVMPDVLFSHDPFTHPSLKREVAHIISRQHDMRINLPQLGGNFHYRKIAGNEPYSCGKAADSVFPVTPGVYLLSTDSVSLFGADPQAKAGAIRLNEYVAPPVTSVPLHVVHTPAPYAPAERPLLITAEAFGDIRPDSLVIYPDDASFWKKENRLYTMRQVSPYVYEAVIPAEHLQGRDKFSYRIAAVTPEGAKTFPDGTDGLPLDWDAPDSGFHTTRLLGPHAPIPLVDASSGMDGTEVSTIPDSWGRTSVTHRRLSPVSPDVLEVSVKPGTDTIDVVLTKFIGDIINAMKGTADASEIAVKTGNLTGIDSATISLVNTDGITYSAEIPLRPNHVNTINLDSLTLAPTLLCLAPYPSFLPRKFVAKEYSGAFSLPDIEKVQIVLHGLPTERNASAEIAGIWLD